MQFDEFGGMGTALAADEPTETLELVTTLPTAMPTGVTVSDRGRVFICFPRWGDAVPATVAELRDGRPVAYPGQDVNQPAGDDDPEAFVSVQSVVVDPAERVWVLDTGSQEFRPTTPGGPKLACVDLDRDTVTQIITFPPDVALPTTYLNDVRFDLRRGAGGLAFITDSSDQGPNALIVADLATGRSWRRLHGHPSVTAEPPERFRPLAEGRPLMERPPGGPPKPLRMGADGIAIAADGSRLYYCPLASRRLYSVPVDALADPTIDEEAVAATVTDEGDKGTASDGLETDAAGRLYLTAWEHNAVLRRDVDGVYETLAHDPRLLWPDTLSVAADGYLYVTANQLHRQARFQEGMDLRRAPYSLFRVPIDAGPVDLLP